MARRKDRGDAGAAGERGNCWNIEQCGVRPLHALALARALKAALLAAASGVRIFGSGRSGDHQGRYWGVGMVTRSSRWQLCLGGIHLCLHVLGHGAHGCRHCDSGHGVADPIQDQTQNQKQAHDDTGHMQSVRQTIRTLEPADLLIQQKEWPFGALRFGHRRRWAGVERLEIPEAHGGLEPVDRAGRVVDQSLAPTPTSRSVPAMRK